MKTRNLILTALFAALTAVFSQMMIPLGPIPFSMGLFAVLLSGVVLDKKYALASQVVYLLLGLIGVPVFGGFSSGPSTLFGMTGGYLIAYPLMAFLTALIPQLMHRKNFLTYFFGMIISLFVCYLLGSIWFAFVAKTGWWQAVLTGVAPFVLPDLVKAALCALLGLALQKALKASKLA